MGIERMPNGDLVNFPEGTTPDQIKAMVAKKFPQDVASHLRETAQALEGGVNPFDITGNIALSAMTRASSSLPAHASARTCKAAVRKGRCSGLKLAEITTSAG